jgi:hypothetical protein
MFHARKNCISEAKWNMFSNAFKKVFHYVPLSFELTAFNVTRMRFKGLHMFHSEFFRSFYKKLKQSRRKFCLHLLATHISVY